MTELVHSLLMSDGKRQASKVLLMAALQARGWTIYGYRADSSDSQADYYNPANWEGLATLGEVVLAVDQYKPDASGKRERISCVRDESRQCAKCNGTGKAPDGNADIGGQVLAMRYGHKPDACIQCGATGHPWRRVVTEITWPVHLANPPRCAWHLEINGHIDASGSGAYSLTPEKAEKLADRITKEAKKSARLTAMARPAPMAEVIHLPRPAVRVSEQERMMEALGV